MVPAAIAALGRELHPANEVAKVGFFVAVTLLGSLWIVPQLFARLHAKMLTVDPNDFALGPGVSATIGALAAPFLGATNSPYAYPLLLLLVGAISGLCAGIQTKRWPRPDLTVVFAVAACAVWGVLGSVDSYFTSFVILGTFGYLSATAARAVLVANESSESDSGEA